MLGNIHASGRLDRFAVKKLIPLKNAESLFSSFGTLRFVSNNIESYSLREGATLTNGNNISFLDRKGGTAMGSNILVSLFKTTILSNVVKVVSSNNKSSLHLSGNNLSRENSTSDRHVASERTFFVDKRSFNSGVRGLNTEANILHKANGLLAGGPDCAFTSNEHSILLLVGLFVLIAFDVILSYADHIGIANPI